jgi:hypothetical protein
MDIKVGETYTSRLVLLTEHRIGRGLHSFAFLSDVIAKFGDNRYKIAECTIPKGSNYYIGEFAGIASLASDTIKYNKIIR